MDQNKQLASKLQNGHENEEKKDTILVFIQNFEGKKQQFFVNKKETLNELKRQISNYTGANANQFALIHNGRTLALNENYLTIEELGMKDMTQMQMVRKCIGGV